MYTYFLRPFADFVLGPVSSQHHDVVEVKAPHHMGASFEAMGFELVENYGDGSFGERIPKREKPLRRKQTCLTISAYIMFAGNSEYA